jgi:hypothetical protein
MRRGHRNSGAQEDQEQSRAFEARGLGVAGHRGAGVVEPPSGQRHGTVPFVEAQGEEIVTPEQSSVVVEARGRGATASRQDGGTEQRPRSVEARGSCSAVEARGYQATVDPSR